MKTKIYIKAITVVLLAGTSLLWSACTDAWDNHYDVTDGGMADQPTLLANIKADPELANFYRVLTAIGATETLNSPQQLTVWAPLGLTSAQADSVIAVYEAGKAAGLKWEDNKAITQFFQNHTALYARPVSSLTNDTVRMLSKKYMQLIGTSATSGSLSGNPFNEAVLCNNGILYKTEKMQPFFPNVREYLEQTAGMDSIVNLIASFDEYELDENSSVAGGVVDGKTVYLDSVLNLSNELLRKYGYIQREDSVYTFLAPTNEVWASEYEKYRQYFNYNANAVNHADSLADITTKLSIVESRFFNTGTGNKYNRHPSDSLVSTSYYERQSHNPRLYVYYKPESADGILNGLTPTECSNGVVYTDTKGVIDPHTSFFGRYDMPAYYSFYYTIPTATDNSETMNVDTRSYGIYKEEDDGTFTLLKSYYYSYITAKTSSSHTELTYTLPSVLSGAYYNIYLVTIPNEETNIPCWFQVNYSEMKENGSLADPGKTNYFTNPHPITEDSEKVDSLAASVILKQSNNQRCYVSSAEKVDTILIQSGVQFTYSSYGLDDGTVNLKVSSFGPSSGTYREKIYTRTLRLNEFILVPFETKEEAEAAADDIDAFNDELLEANKEN